MRILKLSNFACLPSRAGGLHYFLEFQLLVPIEIAVREFCVNQFCTVMHSIANWHIVHPGNLLINRYKNLDFEDF